MSRKQLEAEAHNESMEYVAYFRVSTKRQKKSRNGLEAQEETIRKFIAARHWQRTLATERFEDIESGRNDSRPQLQQAIAACKKRGATLLVSKLDRLARSQRLILDLRDSGVKFVIAEHPEMTEEVVGILSVLAESEAKRIRERICAALAAKRRRGEPLGKSGDALAVMQAKGLRNSAKARRKRAEEYKRPLLLIADPMRKGKSTFEEIGAALLANGLKPPRGGEWHPAQVARLLA